MRRAYGEKEITMQQISSPEKQHLHMQPGISIIRESFHGKMIIPRNAIMQAWHHAFPSHSLLRR